MSDTKRRNLLVGALAVDMQMTEPEQIVRILWESGNDETSMLETLLYDQGIIDQDAAKRLTELASQHLASRSASGGESFSTLIRSSDADVSETIDPWATNYRRSRDPNENDPPDKRKPPPTPGPGAIRYQKIRDYAKGGLGQVFVALDEELKRHVALKQIQDRYASNDDARQRFMLEAEITGGLEHPGVVPVYGLGVYDDGQPYYAMRFIRGESMEQAIADFHRKFPASDTTARRNPDRMLELRKLIGRILDVCQAIAYAHSRGVLHRDIKPDNIMLGKYGETLVVDWGLAKVCERPDSDDTTMPRDAPGWSASASDHAGEGTRHGSVIGTPAFMSPEQASGQPDLIDGRSDVYSLGATLYCLLTGKLAFQTRDDSGQALSIEQLLERIRLSQFKSPLLVDPFIPKPLAAICTRAMANQPVDRYADPLQLADDLERWLADEPVSAYQEPMTARVRRWVKRHQTLAATALAIVLVSIVGLTSFSVVLGQKNVQLADLAGSLRNKNQQLDQRGRELQQSNAELIVAEQRANEKAAIATAVTEFLNDDLLSQASPVKRPDPQLQVRSVFKQAFDAMRDRFVEQPLVKASLLHTIGVASGYLAEVTQSKAALAEAYRLRLEMLGPKHPDTLASQSALGEVHTWVGQFDEAEKILTQTLTDQTELSGPESEDVLKTASRLAGVYGQTGRFDLASSMIERAIAGFTKLHGEDAQQTLEMQSIRAGLLSEMGLYNESLQLGQEVQRRSEAILGASHLLTIESLMLVAQQMYFLNRVDEAISVYNDTLQRIVTTLGDQHPYVSVVRNDL
ncbi:MAG: serine/threonine-protein kinase, partial [Pirellulaceae bacterium]